MGSEAWIGLEVHCRLAPARKLFCGCAVDDAAPPNAAICPTCAGHPGALPWLNREALAPALRVGALLGARLEPRSAFERKHYVYPDLPKGYQITQRRAPLCTGGRWRGVEIERIQLEEDAGRLIHREDGILIDLNRAGAPLVEIVTRPCRLDARGVEAWLRDLHGRLTWLGLTEGRLERGHLRFDVNVSTSPPGAGPVNARVELKNLNSFKFAAAAIQREIARQVELRGAGVEIERETRRWADGATRATRGKEAARDYRFLPEGNLPPLALTQAEIDAALAAPREGPEARRARLIEGHGLDAEEAALLCASPARLRCFEAALEGCPHPRALARWIAATPPDASPPPQALGALVRAAVEGAIPTTAAKRALRRAAEGVVDLEEALEALRCGAPYAEEATDLEAAIATHPAQWRALLDGHSTLERFFIGQVMSRAEGRADPHKISRLIQERMRDEL